MGLSFTSRQLVSSDLDNHFKKLNKVLIFFFFMLELNFNQDD